jgi:hypothetical protein
MLLDVQGAVLALVVRQENIKLPGAQRDEIPNFTGLATCIIPISPKLVTRDDIPISPGLVTCCLALGLEACRLSLGLVTCDLPL